MQNGGEVDVLVYFAELAKQACPGHECDGLSHLGPAELGGDEASCCPHPRVVDGVAASGKLPLSTGWEQAGT